MKNWFRNSLIFTFLFAFGYSGEAFTVKSTEAVLIGEEIKVYKDANSINDFKAILGRLEDFEYCESTLFAEYASTSQYWFFFSLQNESEEDIWIDVANSNLTSISYYRFDDEFKLLDSVTTGALKPFR